MILKGGLQLPPCESHPICQCLSKADFPLLSKHPLKQQGLVVIISNHNSVIRGRSSALSETKNQLHNPLKLKIRKVLELKTKPSLAKDSVLLVKWNDKQTLKGNA